MGSFGAHIDRPNYGIIARKPIVTAEFNFTFVYRRQHVRKDQVCACIEA